MSKFPLIIMSCDGYDVQSQDEALMACFQIASAIYKIANNLICLLSNIVIISHLKQFIRCPLVIIHGGLAGFMNDQSNWSPNRLHNEEEFRSAHVHNPNTAVDVLFGTRYSKHGRPAGVRVRVSLSLCLFSFPLAEALACSPIHHRLLNKHKATAVIDGVMLSYALHLNATISIQIFQSNK